MSNAITQNSKVFYYSRELEKEQEDVFKKSFKDTAYSEQKKIPDMIVNDLFLMSIKLDAFQNSWDEEKDTEEFKHLVSVFNQDVKYCNIIYKEIEVEKKKKISPTETFEEFRKSIYGTRSKPNVAISSQFPNSQLRFLKPGTPAYEEEADRTIRSAYHAKFIDAPADLRAKSAEGNEFKLLSPFIVSVAEKIFITVHKLESNEFLKKVDLIPLEKLDTSGNMFSLQPLKMRSLKVERKPVLVAPEVQEISQPNTLPTTFQASVHYCIDDHAIGICCEPHWDQTPIRLTCDSIGTWSGEVPLEKNWKFVMLKDGNVVRWENRGDRFTRVEDVTDSSVNFTGQLHF